MPKPTRESAPRFAREQITERLVDAATKLLAGKGPAEIKHDSVAEAANVSTMAVYCNSADYLSYSRPSSTEEAETSTGPSKRSVPVMTPRRTTSQRH
ncbi:MAG: TetR/AcrR family transcriptional regulator [Rhodococcus sp. (in: high G+C Gram-positive bacteria)]|nr:MAG: TetR/AcrR family transcriptional regulator [Rhodococcus sp. (in: high G+C Gram-positive bacteria)]